jgi:drug/metabolite transporter (DMT)-like permease
MCVAYALYLIATRLVATTEDALTSLFYSGIIGAVALSLWGPFVWRWPERPLDAALLLLLGLFGGVGHYLVIRAYRYAQVSTLAPLNYLSLLWATAFGWAIFSDFPDAPTVAGAALVAGAGVYVFVRERRLKTARAV